MKQQQKQRSRIALQNAGTPEDRNEVRARLVAQLNNDVEVLNEEKFSFEADFRRHLERWRTERVPHAVPVRAIPSEISDSRLYRVTALFAMLAEMGLAAWVFSRLGVGWLPGALSALVLTATLHGVFLMVFANPERPKETVHRLRTWAALPGVAGFLLALGFGVLARYVYGALAVMLLPFFSFSLWLGTLSLLVLAASLFTMAHILGWSRRYERAYRRIDDEARSSLAFLNELERGQRSGDGVRMSPGKLLAARSGEHSDSRAGVILPVIALLFVATLSSVACTTTAAPDTRRVSTDQTQQAALHILIDWSGSCVRPALEESWQSLRAELPAVIEAHRIASLNIAAFDEDGWCPRTIARIALPRLPLLSTMPKEASEWESFANIHKAIEAQETIRQDGVVSAYRNEIIEAVRSLDKTEVLPPPGRQSHRSDIVGLLRRVAATRTHSHEYFVVLTDLADTTQKSLAPIPGPPADVLLAVLIVPAKPRDILSATGKALSGSEQFELRAQQLRRAVPWVVAAPGFARDLGGFFRP